MGRYKNRLISFEPKENGIVLFVWGRPGIGKTTSVIIPSAQRFGMVLENGEYVQKGAVMVYDMKGDIYDANKDIRKIKRFSLVHPEESCHFDMLERARGMSDTQRAHFLDDLATTLIPDTGNEDSAYFDKVGRAFCTAIFLQCLNEDSSKGFTDICLEILLNSYEYWIHKIKEADYTIALKYCARFEAENPRNVGGGYSKLCEALGLFTSEPLDQMLNPSDNMISPDNLENGIDVYIQVPLGEANLNAPIVAVIFEVFMRAAFQREIGQNPPIAYIIDEFGQIPKMPIIAASAALMRAYNASLLISCQALSQIFATYGEQGSKTLIDCSRGHCIMSINDPDTRDWASRMIGTRKVLRIGGSVGVKEAASRSANEDREPVFQPEAFGLLPLDRSLIIYMDGQYVMGKPTYYLS